MTPPFASVATEATYLEVAAVDSQPHALAAGKAIADWAISVIEVRHADAARITSDTLAFLV